MPSASAIRLQIESALAARIPSALTPAARILRPVASTGIDALDETLHGGLPVGAISELIGPDCSGRTSIALSFVAAITQSAKVCAWLDVSNAFDPPSAAAAGVDLRRLLWVRCGPVPQNASAPPARTFALPQKFITPAPAIKGLHGCGCGGHPRGEVKGMAQAVRGLMQPQVNFEPRCAEPHRRDGSTLVVSTAITHPSGTKQPTNVTKTNQPIAPAQFADVLSTEPLHPVLPMQSRTNNLNLKSTPRNHPAKPWSRLDQALRAADLLLQGGGFSAIVLDMGSLTPEVASRVPLATWFRYRAAAQSTQASFLLLAQYGCAKSSAELTLRLEPGNALLDQPTVFTGMAHTVEVARRRFTGAHDNVVPMRKPPQRANAASWQSHASWAGVR